VVRQGLAEPQTGEVADWVDSLLVKAHTHESEPALRSSFRRRLVVRGSTAAVDALAAHGRILQGRRMRWHAAKQVIA
jgi:hypothetical protein